MCSRWLSYRLLGITSPTPKNSRRCSRQEIPEAPCHCEFVRYLETGSVADSARPAWLPNEADREAPFSVYETDHPTTELDQPFLLVFRTRHVVTMVNALSDVDEVVRDTPGFPAHSQMRTASLLTRGATYSPADTAL